MRLLYLLGLIPQLLWSQPDTTSGIMVGLTTSRITGIGVAGMAHTGFQATYFRSYPINQHFSYQLELGYMLKGARELDSDSGTAYRADLHVVTLPSTLSYHYGRVSISLGISADVIVYQHEQNLYGEFPDDSRFFPLYLNGIVGAGYRLSEYWSMKFRAHYGITPIRKSRNITSRPNIFGINLTGQRTFTLSFGMFYAF